MTRLSPPFPLNFPETFYYGYARHALVDGMKLILSNKKDHVLIPAFICHEVSSTLSSFGISYSYFDITMSGEPNLEDIERKISKNTKAIMVVNYFGFPQNFEILRKFCKEFNLILIEDNAHGFLSKNGDRYLGTYGDIAIFSFRKTIHILEGAALVVNNAKLFEKILSLNHEMYADKKEKHFIRLMKDFLYFAELSLNIKFDQIRKLKNKYLKSVATDDVNVPYSRGILPFSMHCLKRINENEIRKKRTRDFINISNFVQNKFNNIKLLYNELSTDVCPYIIPILTDNKNNICLSLKNNGINQGSWPSLPTDVIESEFPGTFNLKKQLLTILLGF